MKTSCPTSDQLNSGFWPRNHAEAASSNLCTYSRHHCLCGAPLSLDSLTLQSLAFASQLWSPLRLLSTLLDLFSCSTQSPQLLCSGTTLNKKCGQWRSSSGPFPQPWLQNPTIQADPWPTCQRVGIQQGLATPYESLNSCWLPGHTNISITYKLPASGKSKSFKKPIWSCHFSFSLKTFQWLPVILK